MLTRRMPAVETLGAATVLCVDKTGTLTLNRMTVQQAVRPTAQIFDADDAAGTRLPEDVPRAAGVRHPGQQARPVRPDGEGAAGSWATGYLARTEHLHENWTLVREYPLSPELLALSHVWQSPDGERLRDRGQGRARRRSPTCATCSAGRRRTWPGRSRRMADEGLRVLGVARAAFRAQRSAATTQHDFALRVPRPRRPGRSGAADGAGRDRRNATPPASASS